MCHDRQTLLLLSFLYICVIQEKDSKILMAKDILCLCLVLWQLSTVGKAARYCACVKLAENQLFVAFCDRCDYDHDDYQRYNDNFIESSKSDEWKNSIKRRSSCHQEDWYMFNDKGEMCKVLKAIAKLTQEPQTKPTTYIATTMHYETRTNGDSRTTSDESTSSKETQSNVQDDSNREDHRKLIKDTGGTEGVSAGVVVAVVIISFILGLLIMWLIMKYCTKTVLQDIRHQVVREEKMKPPSRVTQQPPRETTNTSESNNAQRPTVPPSVDSNTTSYEGLGPRDRMSSLYNVIDPEQQTSDKSDIKTPQTTGEYFILEKENSCSIHGSSDRNKEENIVVASQNSEDYSVLEKGDSDTNGGKIGSKEITVGDGVKVAEHDYFVLENQNVGTTGSNGSPDMAETSQHISHDYFILEKENNTNQEAR